MAFVASAPMVTTATAALEAAGVAGAAAGSVAVEENDGTMSRQRTMRLSSRLLQRKQQQMPRPQRPAVVVPVLITRRAIPRTPASTAVELSEPHAIRLEAPATAARASVGAPATAWAAAGPPGTVAAVWSPCMCADGRNNGLKGYDGDEEEPVPASASFSSGASAQDRTTEPGLARGGNADVDADTGDGDDAETSKAAARAAVARSGADPHCAQCKGSGEIECPVCDTKGFVTIDMMNTVSAVQCRLCQGRRIIPCPTCREIIYKTILWWDRIPSEEEDPDQSWQQGPDGEPRMPWTPPPV
jgi:hypothetical protein